MTQILIIGAGVAGLSAGLTLAQKGYNVTILEARDRLGGRIYTVLRGSIPIELGAAYWEGKPNNPFFQEYFSNEDTSKAHTIKCDPAKSLLFQIENKKFISMNLLLPYYQQAISSLQQKIDAGFCVGKTCQQVIFAQNPPDYWVKKWLEFELKHHCTPLTNIGFPSFRMPEDKFHCHAWNTQEASYCFVVGGYHKVIEQLAHACITLGVNIQTQSPVININYSNPLVQITTPLKTYLANKVISTIPLGVLKTAHELFTPPLSLEKRKAIEAIGIHDATRVVLRFTAPFWPNTHGPYIFIDKAQQEGFIEFRNGYPLHGEAILQTESYANIAQDLFKRHSQEVAEKQLIEVVMQDLRAAFPAAPLPNDWIIYRWTTDPYAQGSYPYRTILLDESLQLALEQPEGNVYFAGADFSRHGFSVHNGYANGKEIAQKIHHLLWVYTCRINQW